MISSSVNNLILITILFQCLTLVLCSGYYTIIAPGSLKSNRKYAVSVTLHEATEAAAIKIGLIGPDFDENQKIFLQPDETKFIAFQIPKLSDDSYKLIAEGLSGLVFKNESELFVSSDEGPHIYVQSDKKVYKPKDLVQFRVVIVDEHTRPLAVREPIRVEILDADTNRVKQFKDVRLLNGVFTGDIQLSEYPVLGEWIIRTTISGRYSHTRFSAFYVRKYVLPKFTVNLECPKFIVTEDTEQPLILQISAKYTYGKYAEGYAQIDLRSENTPEILLQSKQLDIQSKSAVKFLITKSISKNDYTLNVNTTFMEKHTSNTATDYCSITVHSQPYEVLIDYNNIEFNKTKPYRIKAKVRYWNNSAVIDAETPMILIHGSQKYEAKLNDMGVATFEFKHEAEASHEFVFKNARSTLPNIYIPDQLNDYDDKKLCRLKLLNDKPKLGKTLEVEVSSSQNLPYLVYTLVGHADLIRTERIKVPQNQKSHIIRIEPSIEMVPHSYLYVHYIRNGNLSYEEIKIDLPWELENQVNVSAPKQVKPGAEVTLEIYAQPKSYVCLLAVDLSIYLHDNRYDIYSRNIIWDLIHDKSYSSIKHAREYPGLLSGLITLTNAHYPFDRLTGVVESSGGSGMLPPVRTKFPETWIFKNLEITQEKTQLTLNIPETITTWRITAFSLHEQTGLGIIKEPTDITTFQTFFISLNLPYSVKRGELITIPVTIFNYFNQSLDTKVTMVNEELEYYFIGTSSNATGNKQNLTKQIRIPANSGKTVPFLINPQKVGNIDLLVIAQNSLASDGINQKLKVEPEGMAIPHNQATYISLTDELQNVVSNFVLNIPQDIVPDSEHITLSVGGDMLVPTLENLNNLVNLPTGCGEQNMVNFAPNILILDYLKASGQFAKQAKLIKQAKHYVEVGYQQELSFRHQNGGFSVFGENSKYNRKYKIPGLPSTWLTAYVIRFFIKASTYVAVEDRIIESGLSYLAGEQLENGEFPNTGYLFDPAHQNRYGLTAFILQTFLEKRKYATKYKQIIDEGVQFLLKNVENIEDLYSLAIVAATLRMAKSNRVETLLKRIERQAKGDNNTKWWSDGVGSKTKDVEITAYLAQSLIDTNADTMPILRWLIEQRNSKGGFKSTHDTVVGLQAMVKFARKYNDVNSNLKISFTAKNEEGVDVEKGEFLMNQENALLLQKHELPKFTRYITYEASGLGSVLLQLSYQYHIKDNDRFQHFQIKPNVETIKGNDKEIQICFEYLQLTSSQSTNMVIMEINMPSGYRCQAEGSSDLLENDIIQRIETRNDESTIVLYFDNLLANIEHCLSIEAQLTHEIAKLRPAAILLYDYYITTRHDTVFYEFD